MRKKKVIGIRVTDYEWKKWQELPFEDKETIKLLFRQMITGKVAFQYNNQRFIILPTKKLQKARNIIENILYKAESKDNYLVKPPKWVINDLKKLLEVLG